MTSELWRYLSCPVLSSAQYISCIWFVLMTPFVVTTRP